MTPPYGGFTTPPPNLGASASGATLQPGDLGIDYSFARPDLAQAVKSGAKYVLRYSAGAASDPANANHSAVAGKLITPAEFKAILAAGLDIIANDEWYETRITEGAAAGLQDGTAAANLWKSCGLAKGAAIYVSWDAAPVHSQWQNATAYLHAYAHAIDQVNGYKLGVYGGTPFLAHALKGQVIEFGWRPNAGSWSNDGLPYQPSTRFRRHRAHLVKQALAATPAHLWQTGNYWFDKSCDENLIVRVPVGSHLEASAPTPKPPPPHPDGKRHPWWRIHHLLARIARLRARLAKKGKK